MSQITVKYDPTVKIDEITDLMYSTSKEESPDDRPGEIQQTKVVGIIAPLIKLNNTIINWSQIKKFTLNSTGLLPTLSFTFDDTFEFIKSLDQPGSDNIVQVQILPPFENAYKKINLKFYISSTKITDKRITINAIYNIPALYQYKIESFGNLSTYEMIDKIAKDSELGLAANIDSSNDNRYMYCNNTNYIDLLTQEIKRAGTQNNILDCWIDFHNYIILCDIYERYNAIDNDLKVWTTGSIVQKTETDDDIEPIQIDAIISNSNAMKITQLFCYAYNVISNSSSNIESGTDKVLEVYNVTNGEAESTLIQDGDIKKDTFVKSVYLGEVFGDFNYFLQETCRTAYMQKINNNCIEVYLNNPVLGLERGQRVNFQWFDYNPFTKAVKDENNIKSNTSEQDIEVDTESDPADIPVLNNMVSGQYLIIGTSLVFNGINSGWKYKLILSRPQDKVNKYVTNE